MPLTRGAEDHSELITCQILTSFDRTIEKLINRKAESLDCFQFVRKGQKILSDLTQKGEEVSIKK